jgi:hypothetical protein
MQCNIDEKGRAVRRNGGIICGASGIIMIGLGLWGLYPTALLIAGVSLIVAGGFQLFEASKGWCALRAMGIKTPV